MLKFCAEDLILQDKRDLEGWRDSVHRHEFPASSLTKRWYQYYGEKNDAYPQKVKKAGPEYRVKTKKK